MRASTAALAAVALLAAGCGSTGGGHADRPDGAGGSTRPGCGDVVVRPGGGDDARPVCLGVGRTLRVQLAEGPPGTTETGRALAEVSPGVYRGARPGTAELSGYRPVCPSATPGRMSCHAVVGWKVTVDVR